MVIFALKNNGEKADCRKNFAKNFIIPLDYTVTVYFRIGV